MSVGRQRRHPYSSIRVAALVWLVVVLVIVVSFAVAAGSPLLEWRQPVYVVAGFAGVAAMALLLMQPLLIRGYLLGLQGARGKRVHRWAGGGLLAAVLLHVATLWVTSPPDVVDALLFRAPTLFSVFGVIAMWAVIVAAALVVLRRRLHLKLLHWRLVHSLLAVIVVAGSVIHAMLIEGTMGVLSKTLLCFLALVATLGVVYLQRSWAFLIRRSGIARRSNMASTPEGNDDTRQP